MNWFPRRIVDLSNRLAAWYYRRKYGIVARHLGRPPDGETEKRRGLVILEIDGLAYDYVRQAIRQQQMPYLRRLLVGRTLRMGRWRCGLPSTTPASQAGILYGNNWDIPGFRWYDKATGSSMLCKFPGTVHTIQEGVAAGRRGLLRGGSSYTNMFDGDARLALFTLSALGREHFFENVRGLGFLVLFALSPVRILRTILLSLWTWLTYVVKRLVALVVPSEPAFTFFGPLGQILFNVVFREITTYSVMLDIYRGMPVVYASYTGYDEIAHHFGVDSREAWSALRQIDAQLRQIDRMRQADVRRAYDLVVISDHGMTPSIPFRRAFGETLQQFIAMHTGHPVYDEEGSHESEGLGESRIRYLIDEIRGLEAAPRKGVSARLLRATRLRLEERLLSEAIDAEWDLSRRGDIHVRNSGSLSHVYFDVTARAMDLSEVALLYPHLLEALVKHPGVGWVAGREGDAVLIASSHGNSWISADGERLDGLDPLALLPDRDWALEQIVRLARFPHSGDLILLGAWDGEQVISFEEQIASHGGLGGPQDWPFLIYPREHGPLAQGIENAEQVYDRLCKMSAL